MFLRPIQRPIIAEYSNYFWLCDHTSLDVLLGDTDGSIVGRPWLTIVMDNYSHCMMGFHLGFDPPSSQVLALALRHAILPKHYDPEYNLSMEWRTYGVPEHLDTGGGKHIKSAYLNQIAVQLGIVLHQHAHPLNVSFSERFFRTLNTQLFSMLPGYTEVKGVNYLQADSTQTCLTLPELERILVRYIVEHYNQGFDVRHGNQSRLQRWEAGLTSAPHLMREEDLDI